MVLNYLHWNIDPEIVNIYGISIRYYGLFFITGIVIANYTLKSFFEKENIPQENLTKLASYLMIGIFLGARLGHCFFYDPSYYLSHPLEIFLPITFTGKGEINFIGYQGLASHGGTIGLLTAIYLYTYKTKTSMLQTLDLIAVVAGVSAGFIRLANFMNSEILGKPTTNTLGVIFDRVDNIPRHPAQLYEAISYFAIFTIMLLLYKNRNNNLKNGFFFGLGLVLFFATRIFIELIKENQVEFEEGMIFNMGQLLSIPFIAIGIGFILYGLKAKTIK